MLKSNRLTRVFESGLDFESRIVVCIFFSIVRIKDFKKLLNEKQKGWILFRFFFSLLVAFTENSKESKKTKKYC